MSNRIIKVYNKNDLQNTISEFFPPTKGESLSLDIMQSPKVEIEQNGTSKFTFTFSTLSRKWNDIKNPENIYEVSNRRYTALSENSYVFDNIAKTVSVTLYELWNELSRKYVQAYNVDVKLENPDKNSVILLPKSTKPLFVNGLEIKNNPHPRGSAGYNFFALLQGSEWRLGVCDVIVDGFSAKDDYGVFNVETDQKDILYNLNLVRDLYGGVFVWDSINKILNVRDESKLNSDFNQWKGFEIREGVNAESIVLTQNNDIITVLQPHGEGNLNIEKVNNGNRFLTNFSYTDTKYEWILQNNDIYDQKQLKLWGERKLSEICKPRINYEVSFIDKRDIAGFETEQFEIYDIVKVYYYDYLKEKYTVDTKRIIGHSFNPFDFLESTATIGDKKINYIDIIKQAYDKTDHNSNGDLSSDDIFLRDENKNLSDWKKSNDTSLAEINTDIANNYASIELLTQVVNTDIKSLAEYKQEVTNTYATISSLTSFETATSQNFASINQSVSDNYSSIQLLTQVVNKDIKSLAEYKQEVTNTYATISSLVTFQTTTSQNISSINQKVSSIGSEISIVAETQSKQGRRIASIEVLAEDNESQINIQADEIRLKANKTYVDNLVASKASISSLNSTNARIDNLESKAITTSNLSASIANISLLIVNGLRTNNDFITVGRYQYNRESKLVVVGSNADGSLKREYIYYLG